MRLRAFLVFLAGFGMAAASILAPVQVSAHHAFAAEFDINQPLELMGTVTEVQWTNPHGRVLINVEDENGEVVNWNFELGSPNQLMRQGWRRDALKPGDLISVSGHRARDGRFVGRARSLTRPNGDVVFGRGGAGN